VSLPIRDDDHARHAPSWYAETARAPATGAALAGDVAADVCIVGGGFTGLSAALHLARAGAKVALVEQALIGWGASGRNGGQAHIGMRRGQPWLERHVGRDEAMRFWRLAQDARAHLDWLIDEGGIDCDLTPGLFEADHRARFAAETRETVELLNTRYDYPHVRVVGCEESRALVATDGYHGGMLDSRAGHLQPLDLAHGIARMAQAAGAAIHEHSPATAIDRQGGRWRVATPGGAITADRVVLACNGYLAGLVPAVEARVMPINNFIAVTEPLGEARAAGLIRDRLAVSDSRFVVYYFRVTPDYRLLFGGGENYSMRFPADIAGFVRPHVLRIFPQLRDVALTHAWGGTLAVTPTRMPFVREIEPGLLNLSGYSGMGVVLAPYFGRLVAQALTGGSADFDRLTRLPVPRFPGGRWMRWPTLVAAMTFFALRDRL